MRRLLLFVPLLLTFAVPAAAQAPGEWNGARALELLGQARARRATPHADSGLVDYQARATGYVYFYLDRKDTDERTLVKVDQVALDVYWGAPNRTKQRIVGLRDVSRLPNRMAYHLDHLTIVQDEFGDVIRMGEGDEVRDVPHPAAPGADSIYDFRLADSLTLRLAGSPEPVRVYELQVRPRRLDRPAFLGSLYVDRTSADIVRMNFTFTPVSYVDRRLDYIRVSLDNGLWQGKYWLPHEQRVEIRRQLPELDFPAGGVIRGTLRVGGYGFNQSLPESVFRGYPVTAVPAQMRESFPFETGLYDGLNEEGLAAPPELAELRRQAAALIGRRYLSGLPRLRLNLPNASSVLRYNRAEGVFAGAGFSYALAESVRLETGAGYAAADERIELAGTLRWGLGTGTNLRVRAHSNALHDLGQRAGSARALNTLAATIGEDYLDPYFASGVGLGLETRLGARWRLDAALGVEEHESARLAVARPPLRDAGFRPVRPVTEGTLRFGRVALEREVEASATRTWRGALALEAGRLGRGDYLHSVVEAALLRRSDNRKQTFEARASAGAVFGDAPLQRLFLLGGRGTLPGYAYRSFGGDRFALAELEYSRELVGPWLRLRALAAAGWTDYATAAEPPAWRALPAPAAATDGVRAGAGVGFGLFWDILRLDLVRGFTSSGEWQLLLSVRPDLWDIL